MKTTTTPNKRSFQFLGNLTGPVTGFAGLSSGIKALLIVVTVATVASIATFTSITVWTKVTQDEQFTKDHQDLVAFNVSLSNKILETNVTLCNKIVDVNTTLQSELDTLYNVLDGVNTSIYIDLTDLNSTLCDKIMAGDNMIIQALINLNISDINTTVISALTMLNDSLSNTIVAGDTILQTQITDLNTSLCTKLMDGDALLQTDIFMINTTLTNQFHSSLLTINNVPGQAMTQNLNLIVNGTGFAVQPNPGGSSIFLENQGVVTINSITSLSGSHNLLVTGTGMITINSYPITSTIEVDGSALSTSISNLQMQNNMQQMEITTLEGNVTDLQTQITNLQMVGDMIAQDLNGTTVTFNMTLMELMNEVMTLQSTVASLQAQVMSLSSGSVAPGTISPFGGTVVPTGYLLCDGSQYLQSSYAALYSVIGTMYCGGTCSNMTVFKVPDLRGKIPVGQISTSSAFNLAMGSTLGAETHVLSLSEMPSHQHGGSTSYEDNHQHSIPGTTNLPGSGGFPDGTDLEGIYNMFTGGAGGHSHSIVTSFVGSSAAHNNIQPSLIVKYIIKT